MESMFDRLGNILRDTLDSDEDPFESWKPHTGSARQAGNTRGRTSPRRKTEQKAVFAIPPELAEDFRILGLDGSAGPDECKTAWKKLLKNHHPDLHSGNTAEQEKATQISTRINNSYRRILAWFETGFIK